MSRYSLGRTSSSSVYNWRSGTDMTVEDINRKVKIIYSLVGTLENDKEVAKQFYFLCKKFYADRSVLKDLVRIAKCDEKELIDLLLKYSNPKYDSQNEESINIFLMQKSWSRAL
jgi:hypothetical protein